jgi:hypothetical protein
MSFFKMRITLPRTVELTICAKDEQTARYGVEEFVETAFANALRFWDDNELISDDDGEPLGEVQLEMTDEGMIELAPDAVGNHWAAGIAAMIEPANRRVVRRVLGARRICGRDTREPRRSRQQDLLRQLAEPFGIGQRAGIGAGFGRHGNPPAAVSPDGIDYDWRNSANLPRNGGRNARADYGVVIKSGRSGRHAPNAPPSISRAGRVPSSDRTVRRLILQPSSVRTNSQRFAATRCT